MSLLMLFFRIHFNALQINNDKQHTVQNTMFSLNLPVRDAGSRWRQRAWLVLVDHPDTEVN